MKMRGLWAGSLLMSLADLSWLVLGSGSTACAEIKPYTITVDFTSSFLRGGGVVVCLCFRAFVHATKKRLISSFSPCFLRYTVEYES